MLEYDFLREDFEICKDFYFENSMRRCLNNDKNIPAKLLVEYMLSNEENIVKGHANMIIEALQLILDAEIPI